MSSRLRNAVDKLVAKHHKGNAASPAPNGAAVGAQDPRTGKPVQVSKSFPRDADGRLLVPRNAPADPTAGQPFRPGGRSSELN